MKFWTILLFVSAALALPRSKPVLLDDKCGGQAVRTVTRTKIQTQLVTVTAANQRPTQGFNRGNNNNSRGRFGNNDNNGRGGRNNHNDGGRGGKNNQLNKRPGRNNQNGGGKGGNNNGGKNNGGASQSTSVAAPAQTQGNGGKDGGNNNNNNNNNNEDPQESLTLLESQVQTNLFKDGQETPTEGQVASATSHNNFINFCATQDVPLTNGLQVLDGSCNPTPMGRIIAKNKTPSSKFVFPLNFSKVKANEAFTIKMAVKFIETGNFVNPNTNYYAAPAQVNDNGEVIGHSHIVVEKISSLQSTEPTDPTVFAFFKGVNGKAVDGVLSADVTSGLPKGIYRMSSINAAMNHQPILGAVAQRGAIDDAVYFTVE